jgi:hypothetical protein
MRASARTICCWTATPAQRVPLICSSTRHATVLKKPHLTIVITLSTAPPSPSRLRSDGRHLHHTQAAACLSPSPPRLLPAATTRLSRLPALLPGGMRRSARQSSPWSRAYGCIVVSFEEDGHEAMSQSARTSRPVVLHGRTPPRAPCSSLAWGCLWPNVPMPGLGHRSCGPPPPTW